MSHARVLVSGYASMDRIVKIDRPARVGFTSLITNKTSPDIQYGGCSVNISYDLSKLGVPSAPVIRVGEDYEKIGFKGFLDDGGVPQRAISKVEDERTPLCYLIQDDEGNHITLFYPGSMDSKYAKPISDKLFDNVEYGIMSVGSKIDNMDFLEKCKANDVKLAFSMKSDADAFPSEFLIEVLEYSTIIFTNESEREAIESLYNTSILSNMERGRAEIVVTTLGKQGSVCYYKQDGQVREAYIPICDTGPPVDTAGSGDGYVAGFMYGHLNGRIPPKCSALGTVLSSFIVEKEGCCTGAPNEEQLLERYEWFIKQLKEGAIQ